jgi:acetyl-CoA/propionyl-CoA carboxylase biotin carboxyl carrier protein
MVEKIMAKFKKVLIANRGEIAVRVIQACRELALPTVAIFSEPDRHSKHVSMACEAYILEGQPAKTYLDIQQILKLAIQAGADAIHPGYGFLSENADFARACAEKNITFIGPKPEVIEGMGSKIESRKVMAAAGVPVVPGTTEPVTTQEEVLALGEKYGYPIAIKASAGGGGRGLRVVRRAQDVEQALSGAQREGASYFGSAEVYVEKYLDKPRHIEVQILGDNHGNLVHVFERDCTSQRRHQKLLEETPAARLEPALRNRLLEAAVKAGKALGYNSAGTVECMVANNDFYFLEVNTRIQVEHPISEVVTGIDLVKEQIRVAMGEPLPFKQEEITARGHAIECRINAENPFKNFLPNPGTLTTFELPHHPWVRVDTACYPGYQILPFYDSLLAKLVVWGCTRQEAIERTKVALRNFKIEGVATTIPFHLAMLDDPNFQAGEIYTTYVEQDFLKPFTASHAPATAPSPNPPAADDTTCRGETRTFEIDINQKQFKVQIAELQSPQAQQAKARTATKPSPRHTPVTVGNTQAGTGIIKASMHGLVKEILVKTGDTIKKGERIIIFEAMKMESDITADKDGKITEIKVQTGQSVESNALLLTIGD